MNERPSHRTAGLPGHPVQQPTDHRHEESDIVSALATEQIATTDMATGTTTAGAGNSAQALPCRNSPADLWFAESPVDVELAKALCADCPLVKECLAGALERREPWGVWGGELFVQGKTVARKRPRGRPRKNPLAA